MSTDLFAAHRSAMPVPTAWDEISSDMPDRMRLAAAILDGACMSGLLWLAVFLILH